MAHLEGGRSSANDVVLVSFCRAMFSIIKPDRGAPLPFPVQVGLRSYLPEGRTTALTNLLSAVYPMMEWKDNAGFDGTLQLVKSRMGALKRGKGAMRTFYTYNVLLKYLPFSTCRRVYHRRTERGYEGKVLSPLLSNIGVIQPERLVFGRTSTEHASITTPIAFSGEVTLGFSSFADRMTFTIGFCEEGTDEKRVIELLDLMEQDLKAACGTL